MCRVAGFDVWRWVFDSVAWWRLGCLFVGCLWVHVFRFVGCYNADFAVYGDGCADGLMVRTLYRLEHCDVGLVTFGSLLCLRILCGLFVSRC